MRNKPNMSRALRLLTTFLCAQVCVGQMSYRVVRAVDQDDLHRSSPDSVGSGGTLHQGSTAVNTAGYGFGQEVALPEQRELGLFTCILVVVILIATTQEANRRLQNGGGFSTTTQIATVFTITDPVDGPTDYPMTVDVAPNGEAVARLGLTSASQVNTNDTGLCDGCSLTFVAGECLSGDCEAYDMDATNANMNIQSSVCGDPHMVGLLGQKIDWVGEDGGWYCLISDADFQLNVRVTAPMPEEFPDRQLVSGVSLLLPNGHSLVVEVKDPYTIQADGCVADSSSPCLADGAVHVLFDNEEAPNLQIPGEKTVLEGGAYVSATNLPAECRPFGGDRIWAAQFEKLTAASRSLREASNTTLDEWVLEPDTLAAPTWCAKYVEDGMAGLLATQSNHATLRIETATVDLRLNIGINHQESVLADDGSTVVPELDFWQTDIGLEWHRFSDDVGGMLGDTSRFVFDSAGSPIREGLNALHGPVDSYRVADALGVDFEHLHHK